jgi:superfamily II DNA/RNA helicase
VEFRDSVREITNLLVKHEPLIRPSSFIGQATSKGAVGLKQGEQGKVVKKFKEGVYNVLVATSIGEEGLDIGEVDLIICFDAQASPTRMVQRMGRTGRKRDGRCIMLLSEGTEENTYKKSQQKKKTIFKTIVDKQHTSFELYSFNERMIPDDINPKPEYMSLVIPMFQQPEDKKKRRKKEEDEDDTSLEGFLNAAQEKYYREHFELRVVDEHLAELHPEKWSSDQIIATPVGQVCHNRLTQTLIATTQFIQEHQTDIEDHYGMEMALHVDKDDLMLSQSTTKILKRKLELDQVNSTSTFKPKPQKQKPKQAEDDSRYVTETLPPKNEEDDVLEGWRSSTTKRQKVEEPVNLVDEDNSMDAIATHAQVDHNQYLVDEDDDYDAFVPLIEEPVQSIARYA